MRVMKYDEIMGKSVLVLGKTRSLNRDEFETLLKLHTIGIKERFDEEVALIIEGRMMNPLEQDEVARLYGEEVIPIVEISEVERWLCESLDPNRLLMSLKLSRDQERLVDFIQNPYITDELFFKLLKLYDWQGEGFFDTNSNRDVTAAVIGRFYVDLGRNHNVQYAMSGLAHLVEKYGTCELITAISELSPIVKELKNPSEPSLKGVLDAMALHSATPESLLRLLLKERAYLLAHREPLALEQELLALDDEMIGRSLAQNRTLSPAGADSLEQKYPEAIARHYPLDNVRFERLLLIHPLPLASNPTLILIMQEKLMAHEESDIYRALASNGALTPQGCDILYALGGYTVELAHNPSLSVELLQKLYHRGDPAVLGALASNPSTPIDLLYQLSLDRRYERSVQTNPTFGKHIQTHNIGWNG